MVLHAAKFRACRIEVFFMLDVARTRHEAAIQRRFDKAALLTPPISGFDDAGCAGIA